MQLCKDTVRLKLKKKLMQSLFLFLYLYLYPQIVKTQSNNEVDILQFFCILQLSLGNFLCFWKLLTGEEDEEKNFHDWRRIAGFFWGQSNPSSQHFQKNISSWFTEDLTSDSLSLGSWEALVTPRNDLSIW